MSFFKDVLGDVRNFIVNMLLGGVVVILAAGGTAIWKSFHDQPVPWTLLSVISALALCVSVGIGIFLKRRWAVLGAALKDSGQSEKSGEYSTLKAISEQIRNRPPRPKPELQARIISVGIRGITGGTGITVYLEIDNLGTPSRADGFVASIKSGDSTYDLFPAELPPNSTYVDEVGEIQDITRADTLYEILRNPIVEGGHALGFLFYFAKDVSAAQLTAKSPPEIVIRFRDVRRREYVVTSGGQEPSYPPNVRDPFVALPRRQALDNRLEVTFDNSDCLIVRVINHDPDKDAKIKSVAVFGINDGGEEKQILSTRLPNDPNAIPGGWRRGSLSMPYRLAARDAHNFETLIIESNLPVYGHRAYFAAVTLQTGEIVRSKVIPTKPREDANRPKLVLQNQGVSITRDGDTCFCFTVKNVGTIAVQKADFSFVIQTTKLARPPVVQHEPTSQPIVEGTERTIRYSFPGINPDPAYIAFYVSYVGDGQETKWSNAPVFLIWRGVRGGTTLSELEYLRDEEIDKFKDYLRKHRLPKPLL